MDGAATEERHVATPSRELDDAELQAWVESALGGQVTRWVPISGGNRCRSWAVDCTTSENVTQELYLRYQPPRPPSCEPYTVWREAKVYRLLDQTRVQAPHLIAAHGSEPAILTERVPGRADFRRIGGDAEKMAIAGDFMRAIATLHAAPVDPAALGVAAGATMADCVRAEIEIWSDMYRETGQRDPLIEFALDWLGANVPQTPEPPVLVHGDAGPGNFLFDKGRMTALLDWELAHPGDPMEDLAWFSMRSVMEPVPDFMACLRLYESVSGRPLDFERIRYHRVFVSTRVVIIRHRNVTGEPGNSIVSRALNRRLLVDAIADATGSVLPQVVPLAAGPTPRTEFYDGVIDDLQNRIAEVVSDPVVVAAAKNSAKVMKYLREFDRLGSLIEEAGRKASAALPSAEALADTNDLCDALGRHMLPFDAALRFFAISVAHDAQLAAPSSGGLARRGFPKLLEGSH